MRPSSATAVRSQTPMPAPNRRCSFSMTNPPCRIIGAKPADAEWRIKNGGLIDLGLMFAPTNAGASRVRVPS